MSRPTAFLVALLFTVQSFSDRPILASTLKGRVTRLWTHNGIGDVDVVVAIPGGKRLQAVKTDANGNYSLAELPKGQRVEINYSLDGYQEKPTVHYVTLVDGANRDDARMAPDDAALAEYREYGAKLFQAETTASIDEDIRVILAHLPDEKRTAVTEGYASLAASGRDEDAHKQSIAALLLSFESASRSRTLRHIEESVSALAAQFAQIVPAGRVDQGPVVTVKTHLSSDPPSMRRIPHPA